jgi:CheY-like chemotaxis protein/two-component sensor histidine kinase
MNPKHRYDKVNILLVDDQPARLLSYETILASLGQNLITATSGVEALEQLMKNDFAVILLDVSMPRMDGFETAALIHQHPRFEKTPIIFVTALHVTDLDKLKGYELGAVDYVYVPVVPAILRSKVSVLVELHQKRLELQRVNETLEKANAELAEANSTLQAEKTRELQALNQTLEAANTRLADANRILQAEMAERERLEQALRAADRKKDEFLAMLAHELRNPLAPLRNALARLQRPGLSEEGTAQSLAMMTRQITLLSRLVDELIDISRITSGRIELMKEPVELQTIIDSALEVARPLIEQRGHRLSLTVPEHPVELGADRTRVAQVLSNLLHNAAKYTEPNGDISLTATTEADEVVITVRDSGIGIEPEMISSIFDMFMQVDRSFERSQGGLGIGLTLAQRLVELHGGRLEARSQGLGHGAEFTVRLPVTHVERTAATQAQPARAEPQPAGAEKVNRRIIVADDNADYAESTAIILRMEGHEVHSAYDGMQTVELCEALRPEVVLLDIGLPKLNGYEAARRIRAMDGMDRALLVAISGWGQRRDRELAQAAGFDQHLVKPVDPDVLLQLIATRSPPERSPLDVATPGSNGAGTAASATEQAAAVPAGDGERVLVVDDNLDVQLSAAEMLRSIGYEVRTASDGGTAIELAEHWLPRYVLVDMHMPIVNGFEVARRLRARFTPAQMKVIMMSGVTINEAVKSTASRAGFDACIDKMADPAQWVRVMHSA